MGTLKRSNQKLNITIVILSFVLLVSAGVHRLQMNDVPQQYVKSMLIHVELISLISLIILNFVNSIYFCCHLVKQEWKKLFLVLGVSLGSLFIVVAAINVDAPTLIYMT